MAKFAFCTLAIDYGTKYENGYQPDYVGSGLTLMDDLRSVGGRKEHYFLIGEEEVWPYRSKYPILGSQKWEINFNLKFVPIKIAAETDAEYIIYVDADWIVKGLTREKLDNFYKALKETDFDFYFERPDILEIGLVNMGAFWHVRKKDFKYILKNKRYWDGRIPNEQFMVFKNGPKLEKFLYNWENWYWRSVVKHYPTWAEGLEICFSYIDADMKVDTSQSRYTPSPFLELESSFFFREKSGTTHLVFPQVVNNVRWHE